MQLRRCSGSSIQKSAIEKREKQNAKLLGVHKSKEKSAGSKNSGLSGLLSATKSKPKVTMVSV